MVTEFPAWMAPGAGVAAGLAILAADALHAWRGRRLPNLAFGPEAAPRAWTRAVPWLRAAAAAALTWGLVTLLSLDGTVRARDGGRAPRPPRDLVLLLDVSPSMTIADAGRAAQSTRAARATEIVRAVLDLAPPERVRVTLIAFYSEALPLVIRSADREVIWNFLDRMPLVYAFPHGKTDLLKAINRAGEIARDLTRKNATLLLISDGDTVGDTGLLPLPPAFAHALLVGVGDRHRGAFIDGHISRQDEATLRQLARRLNGAYWDGNIEAPPVDLLQALAAEPARGGRAAWSRRALALLAVGMGAALFALLPGMLERWGARWKPVAAKEVENIQYPTRNTQS